MPDINKHEVDIENLFKQNELDLNSIKQLYKRIEELGEKISQIKVIDNTLANKLKKEYESLKKIIIDENAQIELSNGINEAKTKISNIITQLDNKANKKDTDNKITNLSITKADKNITDRLQSQINTLVLNSGGDSNLEVVQARGNYMVLNDRFFSIEDNISNYFYQQKYNYKWVVGYLNGADGSVETTKKFRISMNEKVKADDDLIVTGDISLKKYTWWIMFFNEDGTVKETKQITHQGSIGSVNITKGDIFIISMGTVEYDGSIVYQDIFSEDVFKKFSVVRKNGVSFESLKKIPLMENSISTIETLKGEINNIKNIVNEKNANVMGIAHRGDSLECPENTMISYKAAYDKGFRILETDVKTTSDGVLVLSHDPTINRTGRNNDGSEINEEINISSITYEEISNYDFGIYKGNEFTGEKIAKLEDLLLFAKKKNCIVYIDGFASNLINKIYLLVNKLGMIRNVIWSSFIKSDLQKILSLDKKAHVVYLYSGATITNSVIDDAASLKTDFNTVSFATYYPNVTDLGLIEYAHYVGIRFGIYTVNVENEIVRFTNAGVDEVTTDGLNVAKILMNNVEV